ncbi:type II toxin-antitoxin system death-on-curing family toxin [Pseudoxanthomonas sangjuensis]|uniref:type II toxin-antitoxin system death-on-curing family toxin n=1 Tax=Pseudoxanthomonas sangjuensis TaxID=1503750 RepID=UPI001391E313|nr:type II toxin-antitoxin system death-on-curing family toxin [Pseudoxanthomonas sangjuensis]KAF1713190.1 type II toxin-antitoxin system death-on-curing family toxin [Pseudoxanthomonas sangjuensis]
MIVWIERALALAIHERQLAEHGGGIGVRDETLLESALARPQQLWACGDPPPDLAALAASLAFGLARNHPFVDGNKRTAAVACELFLALNSATLQASNIELYPVYLSLAEGSLAEADFADWLRPHLRLEPGDAVNEPRAKYRRAR